LKLMPTQAPPFTQSSSTSPDQKILETFIKTEKIRSHSAISFQDLSGITP